MVASSLLAGPDTVRNPRSIPGLEMDFALMERLIVDEHGKSIYDMFTQ